MVEEGPVSSPQDPNSAVGGPDDRLDSLAYRLDQWRAPEYRQGFQGELPTRRYGGYNAYNFNKKK